ncbi:MAG: hypothetical protein R3A10_04820 [Caldilineaceae bacterium]
MPEWENKSTSSNWTMGGCGRRRTLEIDLTQVGESELYSVLYGGRSFELSSTLSALTMP